MYLDVIPIVIDQRYFVKIPRGSSLCFLPSGGAHNTFKKKQSNYLSKMRF